MNTRTKLAIAAGAAIWMVPILKAFAGIDIAAGDWKVDFAGNVNAFYVGASCDTGTNNTVIGGLACTGDHSAAVRNGLLPAALVFSATTRQSDFDIDVTVGFYPGINSSAAAGVNGAGQPSALATPGIDARQVYFTFGDASWGTVKLGRDIGIFGKDAILDDMTLLGVGTAGPTNVAPSNTSLGRIGIGYIYTDWEPQITYTTPTYNGFSGSAGIFQPLNTPGYTTHNSPQFQAGGSYAWGNPKTDTLTGKVWIDVVTQQLTANSAAIAGDNAAGVSTSFRGTEFDVGVKVDCGYVQGTYKFDKLKVGLSYGISDLKLADDENPGQVNANPLLVKRNESGVLGFYYSLTKSVTLVGEYIYSKSKAWGGNSATEKDYAIGGIIFF